MVNGGRGRGTNHPGGRVRTLSPSPTSPTSRHPFTLWSRSGPIGSDQIAASWLGRVGKGEGGLKPV